MAEDFERLLEEGIRHQKHVESVAATEPSAVRQFTEERWSELLALSHDLPTVLHAPTTTHRDRKQLIHTLIHAVVAEHQTPELSRVRIVWVDGAPDTVLEIKLSPYAHREMERLMEQGLSPAEIADELNRQGLLNQQGNPWSRPTVIQAVRPKCQARAAKVACARMFPGGAASDA